MYARILLEIMHEILTANRIRCYPFLILETQVLKYSLPVLMRPFLPKVPARSNRRSDRVRITLYCPLPSSLPLPSRVTKLAESSSLALVPAAIRPLPRNFTVAEQ
jgi:hypothetical protein